MVISQAYDSFAGDAVNNKFDNSILQNQICLDWGRALIDSLLRTVLKWRIYVWI